MSSAQMYLAVTKWFLLCYYGNFKNKKLYSHIQNFN